MRLKYSAVLVLLVAVSFLAVFGARAEADVCDGLTGKALSDCIQVVQKMLEDMLEREKANTSPQVERGPVWADSPVVARSYGHWVGDLTELTYVLEVKPEVKEIDLSRLPAVGSRVEPFVVREHAVEDVTAGESRRITVRYTVQNFAVLCAPEYVSFGPFEVFWRKSPNAKLEKVELPAAKILVSPISLCSETPDVKMAPREMLAFSRLTLAKTAMGAGAGIILAAFVIWGLAFLSEFRRIEASPLYRARRNLKRRGITAIEALAEFRKALREKFGVGGSDGANEVAGRIRDYRDRRGNAPYAEYADEAAGIWEQTVAILYEEREAPPNLVFTIRTFISKISRRETEEV